MSLRRSLDRFLSQSEIDSDKSQSPRIFSVTDDMPPASDQKSEELVLRSSQIHIDSVSQDRVDKDENMYVPALRRKEQTFLAATNLLGHIPNPENPEDRMVLLFCTVQQVGCHVEYVSEITGLDYDYVRRVMQRMHDANIWPPIGTVNQPIPMTAEQCADFSIICDEGLHGKGPKLVNMKIPTKGEGA